MNYTKTFTAIAILFCGMAVFSCKKENSSTPPVNNTITPEYQKRWNISSAVPQSRPVTPVTAKPGLFNHPNRLSRPQGNADYIGIEFLIGSYVIFYSDNTLKVGQYTVSGDTSLILDGLGTIHIITLNSTTFDFVLTPSDGTKPIVITSVPAPETMASENQTDSAFFAATWILDSTVDISTGIKMPFENLSALFSRYGTYLVRNNAGLGLDEYSTNTWLWTNANHNQLCYGSWDGSNVTDCTGLNSVTISLQPPYTHLVVQETEVSFRYYLHKQ